MQKMCVYFFERLSTKHINH
uniref:Uncharacterized protein n=1 Tax=Anguilla anguilla TaxID=7936 RepID=A0A0E9REQ3_ANGAN